MVPSIWMRAGRIPLLPNSPGVFVLDENSFGVISFILSHSPMIVNNSVIAFIFNVKKTFSVPVCVCVAHVYVCVCGSTNDARDPCEAFENKRVVL